MVVHIQYHRMLIHQKETEKEKLLKIKILFIKF